MSDPQNPARSRRPAGLGLLLVAGLVLALAACGSDGEGGDSTASGGDSGDSDFCATIVEVGTSDLFAEESEVFDSPDATRDAFEQLDDALGVLTEEAEGSVVADLELLSTIIGDLDDFYATYDYDTTKLGTALGEDSSLAGELEALAAELESADYQEASDRVTDYTEEECGAEVAEQFGGSETTEAP